MNNQKIAKLRPRARIIRTIGDQLISGPEAAIIELVKNAYDADATAVAIRISPKGESTSSGAIDITDTGHGMTPDVVLNRWFEPATDDKAKLANSPGGRVMLGAKGIGRFAAARLGSKISLTSVANEKGSGLVETVVSIDWKQFEEDTYLDQIEVPVDIRALRAGTSMQTGVRLQITDLRDVWTEKRLISLIRELRRVALPTGDKEMPFVISLDLSDFNSETAGFDGGALLAKLNSDINATDVHDRDPNIIHPFRVNEHADYKIVGRFSSEGDFVGTFRIVRGDGVQQHLTVPAPLLTQDEANCGALDIELNIYDGESEAIADLFGRMGLNFAEIGLRSARKILAESAGIAIFRSGFRIRPYGDPENDWLELERQRVQNPSKKLGLSQVSGKVAIESPDRSGLLERSSREGLEHNGAFARLKKLISGLLVHVEDRRLAFREKAGLSRRIKTDVESAKALASLPTVTQEIDKTPEPHRSPLRRAAEKDSTAIATSLEEIGAYQRLLESRAALGLVVAQVLHEGRRLLNPMADSSKALAQASDHLLENGKLGALARDHLPSQLAVIHDGTKQLGQLFKHLDPLSGRKRGRPRDFNLRDLVKASLDLFSESTVASKIEVVVGSERGLTAHGYPEDYQSALINIVENAIHWLGASANEERVLKVEFEATEDAVRTYVSNNGPPIDDTYLPRLFQAGFSLKSDGTGLGLAIARQASHSSRGDVRYMEERDDTTFVIEFPAGKKGQ